MEVHELVIEMKLLERRLTLYEEKYGVLSEDFYTALMAGELARYNEYDKLTPISAGGRVSTKRGCAESKLIRTKLNNLYMKNRDRD